MNFSRTNKFTELSAILTTERKMEIEPSEDFMLTDCTVLLSVDVIVRDFFFGGFYALVLGGDCDL